MANIEISTDKNKLDINFILDFVSNSYWAKGRTKEIMQICINNSLSFGVYLADRQIGYARVVTDYAQFAYLMDLFIIDDYRGNGYSKALMKVILDSEELNDVKVWRLATADAHDLYKKFGFTSLAHPEKLMEWIR